MNPPLSIRRRRIYLVFFAVVFFVTIPLLILYATGYRLSNALNLVRTGGLYISTPYSGVTVSIGNSIVKETSVFQKNIFVQNLRPRTYDILVTKNGYQTWKKRLMVSPQTVTEGHTFLLPQKPILEEVPAFLTDNSSSGTTTSKVAQGKLTSNPVYSEALALFVGTSTTKSVATTSDYIKTKRKLTVTNTSGVLHAVWGGSGDSTPYYFCSDQTCKNEVVVEAQSKVRSFDFFPGRDDLLVIALSNGVYVIDIDDRSEHNTQYLEVGSGLDFRVQNDETIFIKDGKTIRKVAL